MARFIELMRYALRRTSYKDGYVQQNYSNINKSEKNFQIQLACEIKICIALVKNKIHIDISDQLRNNILGINKDVLFQGEITKRRGEIVVSYNKMADIYNQLINEFSKQIKLKGKNALFFPDLLLHCPGNQANQLLIAEIKLYSNENDGLKYKKDICKLYGFVKGIYYEEAHFILLLQNDQQNREALKSIRLSTFEGLDRSALGKIFVWYYFYGTGPGKWVCMPFREVCIRFAPNANVTDSLNYDDTNVHNWQPNDPDQPQGQ